MAKEIRIIEAKKPDSITLKRVAAYARVSTDAERLMHSLSTQVSYYSELIQKTPGWKYAGVYADEGITGTKLKARTEFQRMIADCEAGKIENFLLTLIQTHVTLGWSQKVSNLKPWSQTKKDILRLLPEWLNRRMLLFTL